MSTRYYQGPLIPDIARHVFGFLDTVAKQNVALVCKFWKEVVYLPAQWRNVTVELLPASCNELLIRSLVKRRITRISCPTSSSEDLAFVFARMPDITYLNVGGCPRMSERQLKRKLCDLPRRHKLKHLVFKRCSRITDTVLEACAPNLKNLKSLVLEDCGNITEFGLRTFLKHVHGLEELDLTWSQNMRDVSLKDIGLNCPELKPLILRGCHWISANAMHYLVDYFPKLVHLDFRGSRGLTDDGVKILADGLPNLKYLNVKECPSVTSKGIGYIADNLQQLSHLSFGGNDIIQLSTIDEEIQTLDIVTLVKLIKLKASQVDVEGLSNNCILRTLVNECSGEFHSANIINISLGLMLGLGVFTRLRFKLEIAGISKSASAEQHNLIRVFILLLVRAAATINFKNFMETIFRKRDIVDIEFG